MTAETKPPLPDANIPEGAPRALAGGSGAFIQQIAGFRRMKVFPIPESELKHLSWMNWLTTLFVSLGASALSFCGSIVIGVGLSNEPLSEQGTFIRDYGVPFFIVLGIVFFAIAIGTQVIRGSALKQIENESDFTQAQS
jgi:hypothetical protein